MPEHIHPNDPRAGYDIASKVASFRKVKYDHQSPVDTSLASKPIRGPVDAGLDVFQGPFGKEELAFLLKRCLPGVRPEDLVHFSGKSLEETLDELLLPDPLPAVPVNDYNDITYDPQVSEGASWVEAPWDLDLEGARIVSLKSWLMRNYLNGGRTIHEKLILFWHNHFVTESWGVFLAKSAFQYFDTLRRMAFGNVKSLTRAMTLDPAMLIYLNGTQNSKSAPDENYARELQELFCLGKGPGSQYTEPDVQAAARVLTGWKVDWASIIGAGKVGVQFYAWDHDTGDKAFSEFYDGQVIEGKLGSAGESELDELLELIFSRDECARHICRRLYQFFVYPDIDERTEQDIIVPMAERLRQDDFELMPVLRLLLSSAHFFHEENRGAMIKHPADAVAGLWRGLGMDVPAGMNLRQRMEVHQAMMWQLATIGMELGDPPSVAGWPAYHQIPIYDRAWITTGTITNRAIASDSMVYWGFWNPIEPIPADLIDFVSRLENPSILEALIDELELLFLGLPLSAEARESLKSALLSGQQNESYWTLAWNGLMADPGNENLRQLVNVRLQLFFHSFFQFAEFQLL